MNKPQTGFTLLEMVVVIALSAIIIIYLAQLQRMTGRISVALKTIDNDWNAQQFIRKQLWHSQQIPLNTEPSFFGEETRFDFITRYSAKQGSYGPYVLASYQYDEQQQQLKYQEKQLANYWLEKSTTTQYQTQELTAIKQVDNLKIKYQDKEQNWTTQWNKKEAPKLVQITYTKGGQNQQFIIETQVLSFSMHSGYSQASPSALP